MYVVFCGYFKISFKEIFKQTYIICLQVLPVSLNCVFEVQNLVLCLTHESLKFLDYKIMLELQCETTFNSAIVGKISSKSNKN